MDFFILVVNPKFSIKKGLWKSNALSITHLVDRRPLGEPGKTARSENVLMFFDNCI